MSKSANYYADTIINAISTIAQNKVQNAAFDKTVIAKVKKCADKTTGKYIINYKDIDQEAYAANVNMKYEKDQLVYVLFPGNNSQRVKTIINTVDHNATTSDDVKSTDQLYNETGPNIITLSDVTKNNILIENNIIQLYSYRPLPLEGEKAYYLYLKGREDNVINIDESLYRYLQQGNSIILTAGLRTNINQSRQAYGQYGIKIVCNFKDNGSENNIIQKEYTLSNFDVIGYPYTVIVKTDIKHLEDFDSQNFIDIESIQAYCYNFLNTENEPKDQKPDIFLYDFAVQGVDRLTESQLNGYHVNINYSANGDTINGSVKEIILKGELKIKGNPITEDVEYYWFRQNGTVFKGTDLYSSYGGDGWECLNDKNNQSHSYYPLTSNQIRFVDSETEQAKYNDIFPTRVLNQKKLKVKCVAVYKTVRESGQGAIYNSNISNDIRIQSSDRKGEENQVNYYFNNGSPTLTCRAFTNQGKELDSQNSDLKGKYFWSINYGSGNIQQITTEEEVLTDYYNKQEEYEKFLKEYEKVQEVKKEEYWNLKEDTRNNWEAVKSQQIVDGKKLINLDISKIKKSAIITCGVQQLNGQDSFYLGTSSITIYNSFEVKDGYSLNIENGIQVYQYNNDGISPASASIEKPIKIKPLSFALIDPEGHIIPYEQILANGFVRWCIPKTNTLLVNSIDNGDALDYRGLTGTDKALAANNTYIIYANKDSISYSIADTFDYNAKNNNIRLYIAYKDMIFDEWTDFTFPKSGDPGTNGTKYYAKIYPTINKDGEEKKIISDSVYIDSLGNHYDNQGREWDKVIPVLYNGSTEVDYGDDSTKLLWSCPIESAFSYNDNKLDRKYQSHFSFDSNNKILNLEQSIPDTRLDILRVQIGSGEDLKFFAELPVCYVHTIEENGNAKYRIKLKEKTGYNYVVYAEDGTNPTYENSNNFELILEKLVNGYYIEQDFDSNKYTYTWSVQGNLELKNENENTNVCTIQPKDKFNGEISKNIVICKIEIAEEESVTIHIPIYMLINRYGHSALNDWDGNNIDLGKDSGTILTPQVGAGKKSAKDNTFTGVLMGQIKYQPKEEEEEKPNEVGLFGYNKGQRTIFLDAQSGKAEFGKNGSGKIIIDPSLTINDKEVALLYSNNFNVLGDTSDGDAKNGYIKEQGLLERNGQYINYQIEQGQGGMLIDLTTPQIAFANGKFNVNKDGKLHSESGDIGGWQITKNTLQSTYDAGEGKTGGVYLNSDGSNTETHAINVNNGNKDIFYTNYKGYMHSESGDIGGWNITPSKLEKDNVGMQSKSETDKTFKAFYAGQRDDKGERPFYVRNDGFFRSTSGRIASWNINDDALYNASVGLGTRKVEAEDNPFKSGTIQARFWAGSPSSADTDLNFIVSNTGHIYSKAGSIGGWNIDEDALYTGDKTGVSNIGIRLFSDGMIQGGTPSTVEKKNNKTYYLLPNGTTSDTPPNFWTINENGNASFNQINASGGVIGNWAIKDGAITNNNSTDTLVELNSDGEFYANQGTIGGCTIDNGGIKTENWQILSNGQAYFTNLKQVNGTIGSGNSLSGSGMTLGGGGEGGGSYVSTDVGSDDEKTLKQQIEAISFSKLKTANLNVTGNLKYKTNDAAWKYTGFRINTTKETVTINGQSKTIVTNVQLQLADEGGSDINLFYLGSAGQSGTDKGAPIYNFNVDVVS